MHLLLTNDYPPKVGGIQTYLWELWRRLPQDSFQVLTSPHADAAVFDAEQQHHIERYDRFWLPPSRRVRDRTKDQADRINASVVVKAIVRAVGKPQAISWAKLGPVNKAL